MNRTRYGLALAIALVLAVPLAGCFNPFDPRIARVRGISEPPPRPESPTNTLRLFEWCWENRSIDYYEELFTQDFRFAFATADTSGNAYLERGFRREDELASARHLFQGGEADQPAASRITMDLDPNLNVFPDSRPGKTYPWHVEIFTRVILSIDYSDGRGDRIDGSARFFLVRGDSTDIPDELESRLGPDPNRWYIERYEEENTSALVANPRTLLGAIGAARPDRRRNAAGPVPLVMLADDPRRPRVTLGALKAWYR